jgi:hypothetical protein
MSQALVADLGPGDALYIPYMWWHHVCSLEAFNVLANYWWNETPPPLPGLSMVDLIVHARIAMAGATPDQRRAWAAMLAYAAQAQPLPAEVPADRGGIMGQIGAPAVRTLRQQLAATLARS